MLQHKRPENVRDFEAEVFSVGINVPHAFDSVSSEMRYFSAEGKTALLLFMMKITRLFNLRRNSFAPACVFGK